MQRGVQHARIAELEKMQADMLAAVQAMSQVREGGWEREGGVGEREVVYRCYQTKIAVQAMSQV